MSRSRDFYEVLGVGRGASDDEIRDAYRKLARKHHPDVNKDDPEAAARFNEVAEAYAVLSDKEKRQAYDRFGHAGVGASVGAGAGPGAGAAGAWQDIGGRDFSEILEQMFSGAGAGGGPTHAGPFRPHAAPMRPRRGADVRQELTVSFMTAARGGTETIQVAGPDGVPQKIDVKIPPGIESGQRLRVAGKGRPGAAGGPPGDVIVAVTVGAHTRFRREGLDVLVDVPLTIAEAALGTSVEVPMLSGSVEIKIPPGTGSGRKLRVKGQGIDDGRGGRGDFYAVIQVAGTGELSDRARDLLEELAPELPDPRAGEGWPGGGRSTPGSP